jgi:hypothetical protein
MVRMSGITAGTAAEPVVYDKDGIVYGKPKTAKPQVSNAKRVSTQTVAEARAAAKARKVQEIGE